MALLRISGATQETSMHIQTVEPRERVLTIRWSDESVSDFPYLFLRDNCPSGFHEQTQERLFDLLSVPEDLRPRGVSVDGGALVIDWAEQPPHRTVLDARWLADHRPGNRPSDPADIASVSWGADFLHRMPRLGAATLLADPRAMKDWLVCLKRDGLSVVTGLADDEEAGVEFGRRIAFLRRTNFGETFRVETKPDPNNLAYTSHALALHTDLPNQEMPPGFQFLHCVRNDAAGGGSVFLDSFRIAERLRREDPESFSLLSTVPIPYRFHDREYDIRIDRPLIGLDERGRLFDVRFSAHLMDVFSMEAGVMIDTYHAFRKFMAATRDPTDTVSFKLDAGEMVVFDNRRVLHGREAFNPATGHRLLRGFYIDRAEIDSWIRSSSTPPVKLASV
jgi:gamma-butyrobetaine dioxygenase